MKQEKFYFFIFICAGKSLFSFNIIIYFFHLILINFNKVLFSISLHILFSIVNDLSSIKVNQLKLKKTENNEQTTFILNTTSYFKNVTIPSTITSTTKKKEIETSKA